MPPLPSANNNNDDVDDAARCVNPTSDDDSPPALLQEEEDDGIIGGDCIIVLRRSEKRPISVYSYFWLLASSVAARRFNLQMMLATRSPSLHSSRRCSKLLQCGCTGRVEEEQQTSAVTVARSVDGAKRHERTRGDTPLANIWFLGDISGELTEILSHFIPCTKDPK